MFVSVSVWGLNLPGVAGDQGTWAGLILTRCGGQYKYCTLRGLWITFSTEQTFLLLWLFELF